MVSLHDVKELIRESIKDGMAKVIEEVKKESDERNERYARKMIETLKQREERRLHNTRLLLENYRVFLKHRDKAVVSSSDLRPIDVLEDIESIFDPKKELILESVKRSKDRTLLMIAHMDEMLNQYKFYAKSCNIAEEWRRYMVMHYSYISNRSYTNAQIGGRCRVDSRTIQRDRQAAIEMYSRFLWGVDSLKIVKKT
jgi:DNA-binding transcriptional MerR regulator